MKVIGLTGGIGTGKSTVAGFLAELGAVVLDTDKLAHEAYRPGTETWQQVVAAFGREILNTDNTVDRKKLAGLVFARADALSRLNAIMHPATNRIVEAGIEECRRKGVAVVVVEAALIVEAGWFSLLDELWVTVAPEKTVVRRLKERSGLSEAEALSRIRAQMPPEERLKHADVVIDTDRTLDEVRSEVVQQWSRLSSLA